MNEIKFHCGNYQVIIDDSRKHVNIWRLGQPFACIAVDNLQAEVNSLQEVIRSLHGIIEGENAYKSEGVCPECTNIGNIGEQNDKFCLECFYYVGMGDY